MAHVLVRSRPDQGLGTFRMSTRRRGGAGRANATRRAEFPWGHPAHHHSGADDAAVGTSDRSTWQRPLILTHQHKGNVFGRTVYRRLPGPQFAEFASPQAVSRRRAQLRRLIRRMRLVDSLLVVMIVNSGAADLLSNFACRCAARGIDWRGGTLVYALDSGLHRRLKASGVASYHIPSLELSRPNEHFGDATYSGMVMWKSAIVWDVLMMGRDVIYQVH